MPHLPSTVTHLMYKFHVCNLQRLVWVTYMYGCQNCRKPSAATAELQSSGFRVQGWYGADGGRELRRTLGAPSSSPSMSGQWEWKEGGPLTCTSVGVLAFMEVLEGSTSWRKTPDISGPNWRRWASSFTAMITRLWFPSCSTCQGKWCEYRIFLNIVKTSNESWRKWWIGT